MDSHRDATPDAIVDRGAKDMKGEIAETVEPSDTEERFNNDLLLAERDRILAGRRFSDLLHVLDHPDLRASFERWDRVAIRAKHWVGRLGLASVALATLALMSSALSPLLLLAEPVPYWVHRAFFVGECAGLLGAMIAVGGLLLARQKDRWIKNRYRCEVLRQWHFQLLICRGREVEESCDTSNADAKEVFVARRDEWFKDFQQSLDGWLDVKVAKLRHSPEMLYEWLHKPVTLYSANSRVLDRVFEAYWVLRFEHQADYSTRKQIKEREIPLWRPLSWPAPVLQRRCEDVAAFCLITSLLLSLAIVLGRVSGWPSHVVVGMSGAIVSLMVMNVAARAVQDGMAAPEETQRYEDYAGKVEYLQNRFEALQNQQEKFHIMQEVERAAVEELRGFVSAQSEARFIV